MSQIVILLAGLLLLTGCVVQSLTPFYAETAVIRMPQLNGQWQLVTDAGKDVRKKMIRPWVVGERKVKVFDAIGTSSVLRITFFRIDSTTFVDITADAPDKGKMNRWWLFHVVPVHTVCKLMVRGDSVVLIPLDKYWLQRAVEENKVGLRHINPSKGEDLNIYYPSTETWMRFLEDHQHDTQAFPISGRYELVRHETGGTSK